MTRPDSESSIERLIKLAGKRDMPTSEAMERARLAAQESWSRMLGEQAPAKSRSWPRPLTGFAIAAGIAALAAFAFTWTQRPTLTAPELVARIATMTGDVFIEEHGTSIARVALPIHAGATLATSEGRLALTFGDSLSLRIDRQTRIRFDSRDQVTLLAGALYVDSGGVNAVPALRIQTPAGVVRHIGTQFQVQVDGNVTRVRVREGRVLLTPASGGATDIAAGDELRIAGDDRQWRRGLPAFVAEWEWPASIAPVLEIENRPLAEFVTWIAREHGWQVRYGDEALQQRAVDIRLHGSLDRLDSDAMLERVALVTGVPLQARDGVLWVGAK